MKLLARKRTVNIARRMTLQRLKRIEASLIEIGGLWGDEDQCLVDLADDLRAEVDKFKEEMDAAIAEREARGSEAA